MNLWARKPVRILAVLLAVLLAAIVAVRVFMPADMIRQMALDQARKKLGREVTIEGAAVSIRGGLGVKLTSVTVANPAGFPGDPLLTMDALDVKLAWRPLLRKEVQVDRLVLEGPDLNLQVQGDGSSNFRFEQQATTKPASDSNPSSGASTSPVINIPHLSVQRARVVYADARAAGQGLSRLQAEDLNLDLSLASTAGGILSLKGSTRTPALTLTTPQPIPSLETEAELDLTWQQKTETLTLRTVKAAVEGVEAEAHGQVTLGDPDPTGSLSVQLPEQALTKLTAFLPPDLAGRVQGGPDSGQVAAVLDITLTGTPDSPFHTKGKAAVHTLDLGLAQPFLPPEQNATIAGRADLDLKFTLAGMDAAQVQYDGTATLQGVSYNRPDLIDQLQSLDGILKLTTDQFTVQRCTARFASGTFDLTGSLKDPLPYFLPPELQQGQAMKTPHLNFVLHTKRLDVDRLLPAASPSSRSDGDSGGGSTQAGAPAGRITAEFPDITSSGTIAADSLFYMQMPFTHLEGQVKIQDKVMDCFDLKGGLYGGAVGGRVAIDLKDLNAPGFTGSYRITDMGVNPFLARFVDLRNILTGAADLEGSFSTQGKDPVTIQRSLTLAAVGILENGQLHTSGATYDALNALAGQLGQTLDPTQSLRDLSTRVSVQDGKIGLEDMSARLGTLGEVSFGGTLAFTGEVDYSGQLLLTEAATARLFSTGAMAELGKLLGTAKPQRLALPLAVGGTRTAPKVKFDLGTVASDLQKQVVQEQGQKLEDTARKKLDDLLKKWK